MSPELNLVVIRSSDIEKARAFYVALGLSFTQEQHDAGPQHYAAQAGPLVLEIYPRKLPTKAAASAMFGFTVESVDHTFSSLKSAGADVITEPENSSWGRRAVVRDPDGHRIELTQKEPVSI